MSILRCPSGHIYNSSRDASCPLCRSREGQAAPLPEIRVPEKPLLESVFTPAPELDRLGGWLVCIQGSEQGIDFRIRNGYNYIGITAGMGVRVSTRERIGTERCAVLCFDDAAGQFLLGPCGGNKLVCLNGQVIFDTVALQPRDVISIGTAKLLFVPLCGGDFRWQNP